MNAKSKILLTLGLIGMCLTIISTVSAEDSYVDSAEVLTTDTNTTMFSDVAGLIYPTDIAINDNSPVVSNEDSYLKTSEAYLGSSEVLSNDTNPTMFSAGGGGAFLPNGTSMDIGAVGGGAFLPNGTSIDCTGEVIDVNDTDTDTNSTEHYYSFDECMDKLLDYRSKFIDEHDLPLGVIPIIWYTNITDTRIYAVMIYRSQFTDSRGVFLYVDRFTGEVHERN